MNDSGSENEALVGLLELAERHIDTFVVKTDDVVRSRLKTLATQYSRYGYLMLHRLLKGEGLVQNKKYNYRLYTEEVIPTFSAFAKAWFEEQKVQWSKSYTATVDNIIFGRLSPYFENVPINEITKQQLLEFRSYMCGLKTKDDSKLSPSHVNRHMKIAKAILTEAAERFGFTNPYGKIKPLKVPKSDNKTLPPYLH